MTDITKSFDNQVAPLPASRSTSSRWASGQPAAGERRALRRRRLRRAILLAIPLSVLGLWTAVHRITWLGPMIADGLRTVVGVEAVTALEDFAYGVEDRFNRWTRDDEPPKAYWIVPARKSPPPPSRVGSCEIAAFSPQDVGAAHDAFSAEGDGRWVGIVDERHPEDGPRLYKTLLHPDEKRSWAAVSIVAVDLRQVDVHLMAGRYEPKAETEEGRQAERPGLVPEAHRASLLAAFNGGFKGEHSHYGMHAAGVTLLPARGQACTIAKLPSGELRIDDAETMKPLLATALWWRQTPQCMLEDGELHAGLRDEDNNYWGATLAGDTVIRRSAIGLSADGKTLFSGIGDHTSARAIALAMKHAGAAQVAQLDVNWSYPKFVLYQPHDGQLRAEKLCDGFKFSPDEYVREPADRDFFYLTRKPDEALVSEGCTL